MQNFLKRNKVKKCETECLFYPKCGKSFRFCPEEWTELEVSNGDR